MAVLEQLTPEQLAKREQDLLLSLNAPADPNDISQLALSGLDIRERELIDSLRRDGVEVNEPIPILSPEEALARDEDTQRILNLPDAAGVDPNDVILNYPMAKEPKIGFLEALKSTKPLHLLPFVGSVWKAMDMVGLMGDAQLLNTGQISVVVPDPTKSGLAPGKTIFRDATPEEKQAALKRVEDFIIKLEERQSRGVSVGGRIAEGIVQLPGFMVEFLLTGPIFKTGSAAAKKSATALLGRFAEKGAGKWAVRAAGAGFGTLARTAVNVPRILSGTLENMTKGIQVTDDGAVVFADADSPFSSLARSFGDLYIENLTEIAGPSLKKGTLAVGAGIGKRFPVLQKFTTKLAEKWIALAPEGVTRTFSDFLKASATKVGYDGILEEMGEEQLGRILRSATGLQTFGEMVPSLEDLLVEAGIFSVPGGVSLASSKVFRKDAPTPPIEKRLGLVGDELITGKPTVQPTEGVEGVEQEPIKKTVSRFPEKVTEDSIKEIGDKMADFYGVRRPDRWFFFKDTSGRDFLVTAKHKKYRNKAGEIYDSEVLMKISQKPFTVKTQADVDYMKENLGRDVKIGDKIYPSQALIKRAMLHEILHSDIRGHGVDFQTSIQESTQELITTPTPEAKQPTVQPTEGKEVSNEDVIAEAERQSKFQLPREGQTTESAESSARANVNEVKAVIEETGGFVEVDIPIEELTLSESHIDKARGERLEEIGGSADPVWVTDYGIRDGKTKKPILRVSNGNNRVALAKKQGKKTIKAFINKKAFDEWQAGKQLTPQPTQPTEGEKEVVETTVKTKTDGIVANVKEAAVEEVGTVDAIRRNIFRAEDALGFWGSAGKKIQRALREISARTAKNVGNTTQNTRNILNGLSKKEKVLVTQMTDGAISMQGQPMRLVARAKMLKKQLDIMQNEAIATGLRKGKLTGRAFPQIPNKKGKEFLQEAETKGAKSHRVFAWAQNQVKEGRFNDVNSAIAALQNYRRTRLRGTEAYFEGTRKVELDLDMREWSPDKLLPGIIEGGWEAIEAARQWGVTKDGNFKSIRTDIERIRGEVGVDQANLLEDYIKAQYGRSRASLVAKKWTKRARAIQFAGKLALSPLTITRNMLDRYAKGMSHGTIGANIRATIQFPPFLNKFMKSSQKIQDEMIRRGAVLGHGHLSEGFASGGQISQFLGRPFAMSERGNQTYIALVKKIQLEADIKRLHEMGGETGTVGKMYDRMLSIIGKSQSQTEKRIGTNMTNEQLAEALALPEVPDDVMSEVLHRVVTDSAFPLTLASKRMWWGSRPFVEMMTQFKVWSTDQMRFIYKDVLKYTVATGDPSRLARFVVATWFAGELYNIARDFLLNRDESLVSTLRDPDGRNVKEISKSIGNALVDGGIVGMLADLTYGLTDWAFGPTVGSIESIARTMMAVKNDPATTTDGIKKFLLEDVPVAKQVQGVIDRLDRTFFDDEKNNLTANYVEWRQRGFEFRRKEGELTAIERTTGRVVLGRPSKLPGPRTLSHEMIARQVLVGDYGDAAEYMKGIIRDAPVDKVGDVVQGIDTSAKNRSPFGNISKEKLPLFLSKFSVKGQAEGIKLQIKWLEGYKKARKMAIESLISEGFEKELEIKAEEFRKKVEPKIEKFESTISELEELLK